MVYGKMTTAKKGSGPVGLFGSKKAKPKGGMHMMPDGKMMKNSDMKKPVSKRTPARKGKN